MPDKSVKILEFSMPIDEVNEIDITKGRQTAQPNLLLVM